MDLRHFGKKAYRFIMTPYTRDARVNILHGAVRSQKTWSMIPKLLYTVLPTQGRKGMGLITGVSKTAIKRNVLNDIFNIVGERNYHYNSSSGELTLMGYPIQVVGAKDEGSEKYIRGGTFAWGYGDELIFMPEPFFELMQNRMSIPGAKFYGTTNPDNPLHWLNKKWLTDAAKVGSGMVRALHFGLNDNPTLTEEYKAFINAAHKGVYNQRFVQGLWVVAEGAIYKDCWSDSLVYNDQTFPAITAMRAPRGCVDRWVPVDYGTVHRQVYLDMLDDGTTVYIDREYVYDSADTAVQKTDREYADDLEEFLKPTHGALVIVPPESASFKAELQQRGIWNIDADNEVLDGIRMVSTMMGLKRLRIHERCTNLLERIPAYTWDPKKALRGEEAPVKANDDEVDAMRYGIKTKIPAWRIAA